MAETLQSGSSRTPQEVRAARGAGAAQLVRASQVARDTPVRKSVNGVRFATFGETGLADPDLDRMLEAVPAAIVAALNANTYYFVPLALREADETGETRETADGADGANEPGGANGANDATGMQPRRPAPTPEPAMVASAYTDELSGDAICHRNVELGHGKRGVFISTRLMGDRFALSFEFFINVAHAFVDQAGVPAAFSDLVWKQAVDNVRGETSLDAWESRNLAFGRPANAQPPSMYPAASPSSRRGRGFGNQRSFGGSAPSSISLEASSADPVIDEKERGLYLEAACTDAVAMYLLSLALDFDYSELRERDYPLLAPAALATRLRSIADLFPPNPGYEFAVRYRRRA